MPLNKSRGNMYNWCTHTFNVIKGECPHQCSYCYCKRWGKQSPLHFDEKALKTNLSSGNTIFVGSSCDMWASDIHNYWIEKVLYYCRQYQNCYLFQSKNPYRFTAFMPMFPDDTILATTIETNRPSATETSNAPPVWARYQVMRDIHGFRKMVSIEPIMDFNLDILVDWISGIKPEFVSIGADSGENHLPEPSPDKVKTLIEALKKITEVKIKDNLKRLL